MVKSYSIIPAGRIETKIYVIRGHQVMFDSDLAKLYAVTTKRLNEQVKRNIKRFPHDFMFQLTLQEAAFLRSHFATIKQGRGKHSKYLPYVFTEHGVAMLSSVLNSEQAVQVNIEIIRAFVRIRSMISSHKKILQRIERLEQKYDTQFKVVFDAIKKLMEPPKVTWKPRIGFRPS